MHIRKPGRELSDCATEARVPWWQHEAPGVILLVAVAAGHFAFLLLSHRTYFAEPDNTTQFWAWYQKAASVLHAGALPLWDANTLAGHSFVGETQTGVFYPLNILWLLVLGSAYGIGPKRLDMLVELHVLLASLGFYALARSFSVRRLAAVIAAVSFAYTGVVFSRSTGQTAILFGLAYVPWAVFLAHRHLETERLRFAVGAGAAIGLGVLAGHFQPPFHAALLVVLFYALTMPRTRVWRPELLVRFRGLLTTFAVAVLVALPQLAYSLRYLNRAYRFVGTASPVPPGGSVSYQTFSQLYSGGPDSVLSLLDPQKYPVPDGNELFISLAALTMLTAGILAFRRSIRAQMGRYSVAIIAAAVIGGLAMLGPWTYFPRILYVLPLVTEVRELARYSIMVHLVLCLLVAFALQAIGTGRVTERAGRRPRRALIAGAAGGLIAINGVYLIAQPVPGGDRWFGVQLLLAGITLLVFACGAPLTRRLAGARLARTPVLALIGVPIVLASLHNGTRFLGSTSWPLYPTHYYARTPEITYAENACAGHRTLVLENALPTNVGDVYRKLRTENGYGATLQVAYYDFIESSPYSSPEETRLLDERCIVARQPVTVPGYRVGFRDPTDGVIVYVDDHTSSLNTPQLQPIPAIVLRYNDRDMVYEVDLTQSTKVIVSAIVYPGWHVRVDGRSVSAGSFRVGNVPVFPEVTLPPGRHTLEYGWSGWPA